ncbi:MAG: arsenate reductase (glutaredoxin), partial [Methylococcales bacterium]|nr:arsenate reductase (glutaredoxin) [Methylococcales bacterium]
AELKELLTMLGIPAKALVRTGEALFKELGLGDKDLSEDEWVATLANNPQLIERPIVVHNGKAAIGRPIEKVIDILS